MINRDKSKDFGTYFFRAAITSDCLVARACDKPMAFSA